MPTSAKVQVATALALWLCSTSLLAHGFGERYELPVPLWLFLASAGLVVLLSFIALVVFPRFARLADHAVSIAVPAVPTLGFALRALGLALFILVVVAGFAGPQSPLKNIAPLMVWAVAWVGLAYVCAFVGNAWQVLNPFDTAFRCFERLHGRPHIPPLHYPAALGQWPAVLLYAGLVWMELAWEHSDRPSYLAAVLLGYALLSWIGMLLFGRESWLRHGEAFSVVYATLARFAPLEWRNGRLVLRPYASGLMTPKPLHLSIVTLVLLMLSSVSFDGFLDTAAWSDIAEHSRLSPSQTRTAGLASAAVVFIAAYALACAVIALPESAGRFALALLPIAIGYHLAHYLSFLSAAKEYLIPLASDPLGFGWDLFGGALHFVRGPTVGARTVWYVSVAAITIGHVVAIYVAHAQALREFADDRRAMQSQYAMVALMVCYTVTSLWIIAQPIVSAPR